MDVIEGASSISLVVLGLLDDHKTPIRPSVSALVLLMPDILLLHIHTTDGSRLKNHTTYTSSDKERPNQTVPSIMNERKGIR